MGQSAIEGSQIHFTNSKVVVHSLGGTDMVHREVHTHRSRVTASNIRQEVRHMDNSLMDNSPMDSNRMDNSPMAQVQLKREVVQKGSYQN
jgi:flagellar basal body P-ring protein FlgI